MALPPYMDEDVVVRDDDDDDDESSCDAHSGRSPRTIMAITTPGDRLVQPHEEITSDRLVPFVVCQARVGGRAFTIMP